MSANMAKQGLLKKISERFFKPQAQPQLPRGSTSETSVSDFSWAGSISNMMWQTDPERRMVHIDIDNMDDNDGIVAQALDTIADTATGFEDDDVEGFYIKSDNKQVLKILNAMVDRVHLRSQAWNIIRNMAKYANEFLEPVIGMVDGQIQIIRIKDGIPEYEIHPNLDKYGNFDEEYPWLQKIEPNFNGQPIKFRPWQLIHFHYGPMRRKLAIPALKAARRNWKRLQIIEDLMALARMIRAYVKLVHKVPVDDDDDAEAQAEKIRVYKETMTRKIFSQWMTGNLGQLDQPLSVDTDFYLPDDGSERGSIDAIDAKNANLQNIDDIKYAQGQILCRLGVPRRYLNIEGANNNTQSDGGSDHEERHFARKIRAIQSSFKHGITQICYLELLLHGIAPWDKENAFTIGMAEINSEDQYRHAQAMNTIATAIKTLYQIMELPKELILSKFLKLSDYERSQYGDEIKFRKLEETGLVKTDNGPNAGRPSGRSAGSNDNNGKVPKKDHQGLLGLF
jgi:hypothetical protein